MGQTNASVPSGPFDDRSARSYAEHVISPSPSLQNASVDRSPALFLCVPNDPDGGAVLDAASGILKLGLAIYITSGLFRQRLKVDLCIWMPVRDRSPRESHLSHQRGVSHGFGEALDGESPQLARRNESSCAEEREHYAGESGRISGCQLWTSCDPRERARHSCEDAPSRSYPAQCVDD